jgi:transcriptional regulator with XRE-family HTH domain
MPEVPDLSERQVWGAAVKALRLRAGLTLNDAASAYEPPGFTPGDPDRGLSVQRWQQIEKGSSRFTVEQRATIAKAVGATIEELELERARILGHRPRGRASGMAEPEPRGWAIPIYGRTELDRGGWRVTDAAKTEGFFDLRELTGASIGVTHVADDSMGLKAAPGTAVIFDRGRRPAKGKGCVVETVAGEMYVRLFDGVDHEHVIVRAMAGKPLAFRRELVKGVYAVRFWGD